MFYIISIAICILTIIILGVSLNINFKKMKQLDLNVPEDLINVSSKFPEDEVICKDILKKLNVKNVKVCVDETYTNCLYTVFNNKITIGKFKQDYMKVQTIAHECIHASQNKITVWANFIFSNIYLLYFAVISILTITMDKLQYTDYFFMGFIFMSIIQYILRNTLEMEAMIKARFIAKEYLEEKKILTNNERERLLEEYDRVNKLGIPFINYYTITMNLVKIIFLAFIIYHFFMRFKL